MDRNSYAMPSQEVFRVALRKESVDRNSFLWSSRLRENPSLSARRAWIEMVNSGTQADPEKVALRKESVDRNDLGGLGGAAPQVALRKESVDRNRRADRARIYC